MITQDSLFNVLSSAPSIANNAIISEKDVFLILQTPPEGFVKRKGTFGTCAHHSLKAVIEGKNREKKPLTSYACDWWSRLTYLMTPLGIRKVLRRNGLDYEVLRAKKMGKDEKLSFLKSYLKKGPIILLIANGLTKKKFFSWKKALTHWHYITLWGYNDKEGIFYVYDSNTDRDTEQYLMKGTVKIPYHYVLKSWSIGATKLLYNYAISVKY